jgi:hypothetical protein
VRRGRDAAPATRVTILTTAICENLEGGLSVKPRDDQPGAKQHGSGAQPETYGGDRRTEWLVRGDLGTLATDLVTADIGRNPDRTANGEPRTKRGLRRLLLRR